MKPEHIVDINSETARCKGCGANITDVANFTFTEEVYSEPTYREEVCKCKHCGTSFLLHYDIFDSEGHVFTRVFSEDINNPDYHWPEALTDSQKKLVSEHLESCIICQDRLENDLLTDVWLKSIITQLKGKV